MNTMMVEFIDKYEKSISEDFNIILRHLNDEFYEMTNKYQSEEKMILKSNSVSIESQVLNLQ